jgi:uncharacterized protein DUF3658/uncharacterized protein DUF1835
MMMQTTLHIVFSLAADTLMQALKNAGRDDQVIACPDDLRFGPINPPDPSRRAKWVEDELGWRGSNRIIPESDRFWRESLSPNHRLVAWLSRRSAIEYAGFLEWLWRLGERPCEVVDLTDLKVSQRLQHLRLALSVALLPPDEIAEHSLYDRAQILPATARSRYHALWAQLRAENAPLRVLSADALVSVPISFFDSLLMSFATDDWRKVAMIVGLALGSEIDNYVIQSSDIFLAARVNALVETGRLELRGRSALEMRFSEVRLARPG